MPRAALSLHKLGSHLKCSLYWGTESIFLLFGDEGNDVYELFQ